MALLVLLAVPFTRTLVVGFASGEPICEDLRPLSYHVRRLSDPDQEVVDDAIKQIGTVGERGAPAIPALLELARDPERGSRLSGKSKSQTARESALSAIEWMRAAAAPAVPELIPFLSHPSVRTRRAAVAALRAIGPAAVADPRPLAAALRDPGVQDDMSRLLAELATDFYKDEIHRLLTDGSPRLRGRACDWAGRVGPPGREFLPALEKALADPDPDVRAAAAEAIRDIRSLDDFKGGDQP